MCVCVVEVVTQRWPSKNGVPTTSYFVVFIKLISTVDCLFNSEPSATIAKMHIPSSSQFTFSLGNVLREVSAVSIRQSLSTMKYERNRRETFHSSALSDHAAIMAAKGFYLKGKQVGTKAH